MSLRDRARDGARLLFGWIWRRAWARIESRLQPIENRLQSIEDRLQPIEDRHGPIESRLQPIEERLQRVEQLDAAWNQHVPAFLNAVATVGAFGHELAILRRRLGAAEVAAASLAAAGERADGTEEAPENDSDYHHDPLTPDGLRALLLEAGFTDIAVSTRGRTDGRQIEIVARKPPSGAAATQRTP